MNSRFPPSGMTKRIAARASLAIAGAILALGVSGCDELNIGKGPNYGATSSGPQTQFSAKLEKNLGPPITANAIHCDDTTIEAVKAAGAIYIGDLQVIAHPSKTNVSQSLASEMDVVNARAAIEAANQGATHFLITASDIQAGNPVLDHSGGVTLQDSTIHYGMYRLDPSQWGGISPELRPTELGATPPPLPSSSPTSPNGAPSSTPPGQGGEIQI